jgi:hypothetical protein
MRRFVIFIIFLIALFAFINAINAATHEDNPSSASPPQKFSEFPPPVQ